MTFYAIFPDGVILEVASWDVANLKERSKAVVVVEAPDRTIPKKLKEEIIESQDGECKHCREKVTKFHIDHIHPYSQLFTYPNGYSKINERANLQALCPTCNLSKHDTWEFSK